MSPKESPGLAFMLKLCIILPIFSPVRNSLIEPNPVSSKIQFCPDPDNLSVRDTVVVLHSDDELVGFRIPVGQQSHAV